MKKTILTALACIPLFLTSLAALAEAQAEPPANDAGVCVYVVKKGDTLSEILIRLGIQPQYGPTGTIARLATENDVARQGDLIFPNVGIRIPRELVGKNEICLDGKQEQDASRRIALYSQAEAQIQKTQYASLCRKIVAASATETDPERRGRLLHFAAICEYEENDLESAYNHWQSVLQLQPDPSLLYRTNYNLALLECQSNEAVRGYERLLQITPELWQSQTEGDRRAFLDLAGYCSEKGPGIPAKLDILMGVLRESRSEELRQYAVEKLVAEFSDPNRCEQSKVTLGKIPPIEKNRVKLEAVWNKTCAQQSSADAQAQISLGPSFVEYSTSNASQQWWGVSAALAVALRVNSRWVFSTNIDTYLRTLSQPGTADVRSFNVMVGAGKTFHLAPDLIFQPDLIAGQSSLITSDRTAGYFDFLSYGVRLSLRFTEDKLDWLKTSVSFSFGNSDTALITSNSMLTFSADFYPEWADPFFIGAQARYSMINWNGANQRALVSALQVGAHW
jgi:tetratricopeptide (TPR) repeat protein